MKAFEFLRPTSLAAASRALDEHDGALLKAGGIDTLDRLKERVDEPDVVVGLVDVGGDAAAIAADGDTIRIGALATLADIAASDLVRRRAPSLARACHEAASPQLRHRATLGGNLAQHTRCGYYRHRSFPCLKRGDDTCPVRQEGGVQEMAGIFANDPCASAHPSSVAPALGTLDAVVHVRGPDREGGEAAVPFADLWASPAKGKASDTTLGDADVITAISVTVPEGLRTAHEEIRQKAAFDWALVSCAVAFAVEDGKVARPRIWLGSVAPTPWRAEKAEAVLEGKAFSEDLAVRAAEAALDGADPLPGTAYKKPLVRAAVRRALVAAQGSA